ncbi:MAG TPA: PD-(D/E)XK nuclease family protein [Acidobacteriota bacterium]|nr:PD-(D/E)XK nuclease family protein [Acidobacteriota bacterium]
MSLQIREGGSYRRLLDELLEDVAKDRAENGLQPLWLVTPTASVANHLRWTLARGAANRVMAGVRVVTVGGLLARLGEALSCPLGHRRHPRFDLLLLELCRRFPELEITRRLNEMPAGQSLLFPTFFDLADGGFGTQQEDLLKELALAPQLKQVEREMLTLYYAWLRLLLERRVEWMPLQVQRLAQVIEEAPAETLHRALRCCSQQQSQVWLYGFYDLTDVNLQVVCACARKLPLRLYFPALRQDGELHPAFESVQDLLEEIGLRMGGEVEVHDLSAAEADPKSPSPREYFSATFPQGPLDGQPACVSFQKASGLRAEALAAALQTRRWLDAEDDLQPQDIIVAAPAAEAYLPHLREAFQSFALPLRIQDVKGDPKPELRALRGLVRLLGPDAEAEPFLDYLRDHPQLLHSHLDLDQRLRKAGIWGGPHWKLLGQEEVDLQAKAWIERFLQLGRQGQAESLTPAQALGLVEALQRDWISQAESLRPLGEALANMQQSTPDLPIPLALLQDLLSRGPEQRQADDFNRRGVCFTTLMRSRGLTARRLIVMGLSSRHLPRRVDEDPLLSDDSRRRLLNLARDVGHRLPIKARAGEEQLLLFYLLNTSADRVHWIVPESDESGRRVAASPWVQRYLTAWNAERRATLPRGPREQARHLLQQDSSGALLPPRYGGLMGRGRRSLPGAFSGASLPLPQRPLSVTALQDLARCPFRFYAARVAGWEPLAPLLREREMAPLQRGKLLHEALQDVLAPALSQQLSLAAAARRALGHRQRPARRALQASLRRACHRKAPPHPLLKEAEVDILASQIEDYLRLLCEQESMHPKRLEARMKRGFPGLPQVEIEGRLDRVDEGEFGGADSIVDYKAGVRPPVGELEREIQAGFQLQPSLYPWLWRGSSGEEGDFVYVFLGDSPPCAFSVRDVPPAQEALASLRPLLQEAVCTPLSNEACRALGLERLQPCRYCDFASVCRRHDASAPSRMADHFRSRAPSRLHYLQERLGQEEGS